MVLVRADDDFARFIIATGCFVSVSTAPSDATRIGCTATNVEDDDDSEESFDGGATTGAAHNRANRSGPDDGAGGAVAILFDDELLRPLRLVSFDFRGVMIGVILDDDASPTLGVGI